MNVCERGDCHLSGQMLELYQMQNVRNTQDQSNGKEIRKYKWEPMLMDFISKLPKKPNGF